MACTGEILQLLTKPEWRLEPLKTKTEFWMNDGLPLSTPRPPQFVTVCLRGNVLLPSKLHWGNLKTGVAQQQRPCKSTRGAERRREGGRQKEGSIAAVSPGYQSSVIALTFAGWYSKSVSLACSSKVPTLLQKARWKHQGEQIISFERDDRQVWGS